MRSPLRPTRLAALLLALGFAAGVQAEALPAVVDKVLLQQPSVRSAQALLRAADAQITQARSDFLPSVGLSYRNADSRDETQGRPIDRNIRRSDASLRWNLFNGGADTARVQAGGLYRDAAEADLDNVLEQVSYEITEAYSDIVRLRQTVDSLGATLARQERVEASVARRVDAGRIAPAELDLMRVRLIQNRALLGQLRAQLGTAEYRYRLLTGQGQQPGLGHAGHLAGGIPEDHTMHTQDGIHTHLGHDGKQGGHGRGGGGISARQPQRQRQQGRLEAKYHQQDQGRAARHHRLHARQLRHPQGQVGQVERARDRVQQGHADQEEGRCQQVEDNVMHPGLEASLALTVHHQHVGRDQQDLEENEEVEDVASDEGATQPHQLKMEDGVEVAPMRVPPTAGVPEHRQGHQLREHQHQRRKPVDHQHNAEGRRPLTEAVHLQGARAGLAHQAHRNPQAERHRAQAEATGPLAARLAVATGGVTQQEQRHAGEGWQQHRQDGQMRPHRREQIAHARSSPPAVAPSTWSVPDS